MLTSCTQRLFLTPPEKQKHLPLLRRRTQEAGRLIASTRWPTPPEAQYVQRRRPDRYLPIRWNGGYGDKTLAVGGWRISRGYPGVGLPFAFLA